MFFKKTKIICTIGPASLQKETLEEMYKAGMNAARINTAYGCFNQHKQIINNVRETADIPLILDLKGPEIRLHVKQGISLKREEVIEAGFGGEEVSFNHDFYDDVSVSDQVYIDNGRVKTKIVEKSNGKLSLLVITERRDC